MSELINTNEESSFEQLPTNPESKVSHILQDLEILALQQKSSKGFDLTQLNPEQFDKFIGLLEKNEDNALKFHTKRLDTIEKIQTKRIDATTTNQKTIRIALIISLIVIPTLTVLILFYKDTFFIPWLTFLTGLAGGVGLSKAGKLITKEAPTNNPIPEGE